LIKFHALQRPKTPAASSRALTDAPHRARVFCPLIKRPHGHGGRYDQKANIDEANFDTENFECGSNPRKRLQDKRADQNQSDNDQERLTNERVLDILSQPRGQTAIVHWRVVHGNASPAKSRLLSLPSAPGFPFAPGCPIGPGGPACPPPQ
jgi:hypothetical protein